MENFQKIVVAWSKLASVGARPLAESVGIDRDFFARVLNNRRELPQGNAKSLGDALGLVPEGFVDERIRANLCRQLEDLAALESLGFKTRYLAHIKSHKEMKGGKSLQKYLLVNISYRGKNRLSILRMATEKWQRLIEQLNFPELPIIEVDTLIVSELNSVDAVIEYDCWKELEAIQVSEDSEHAGEWMQKFVEDLIQRQIEESGGRSQTKRIERKTDLLRIANKYSTLADWPSAAVNYAETFILTPISHEFAPAMAVGIRRDEKRVFVYLTSLRIGQSLTFDLENQAKVDQILVFFSQSENSIVKYDVLYDGSIEMMIEAARKNDLIKDGRIVMSIRSLQFLDEMTKSEHSLKRRKNRGG